MVARRHNQVALDTMCQGISWRLRDSLHHTSPLTATGSAAPSTHYTGPRRNGRHAILHVAKPSPENACPTCVTLGRLANTWGFEKLECEPRGIPGPTLARKDLCPEKNIVPKTLTRKFRVPKTCPKMWFVRTNVRTKSYPENLPQKL